MSHNGVLVSIDEGSFQGSSSMYSTQSLVATMNPIYVNQAGDKMDGNLDMKNNKFTKSYWW